MEGLYLPGIDIGTTGSKMIVVEREGNPLGSAFGDYPCTYHRPNWVEQDVHLVVDTAMRTMREAIRTSGRDGHLHGGGCPG